MNDQAFWRWFKPVFELDSRDAQAIGGEWEGEKKKDFVAASLTSKTKTSSLSAATSVAHRTETTRGRQDAPVLAAAINESADVTDWHDPVSPLHNTNSGAASK